ncbi:MAG: protoporphyrinogen oxidase, partial [Nitrospirae bacterium]|nr:protoporphyrinogen oxidase [Candidatus Troglogloeales bacterium]
MKKKIAIIGGGITGLSTAFFLQEKLNREGVSADVNLIESDARLGGKIVTERVGDFIIEGGPDSFLSQKPWGINLCRKLGLIDRIVQTNPIDKAIYILSHGKLQKFPEGMNLMVPGKITPFLLTPLVSFSGKARMGLDLFIPRENNVQEESIGSFVRRRLGEEAVA